MRVHWLIFAAGLLAAGSWNAAARGPPAWRRGWRRPSYAYAESPENAANAYAQTAQNARDAHAEPPQNAQDACGSCFDRRQNTPRLDAETAPGNTHRDRLARERRIGSDRESKIGIEVARYDFDLANTRASSYGHSRRSGAHPAAGGVTHPQFQHRYWGYNHHYNGYRRGFYGRRYYNRGMYGNQMAMRWLMRLRRDLNSVRRNAPNPMYAQRIARDLNGVIYSRYSRPAQGQLAQLASDSTVALAGRGRSGLNSMSLARHYMTVVNRGSHHPGSLQSAIMGSRALLLRAGIPPGPAGTVVGDLSAIASGNGMFGAQLGMVR